MNLQQLNASGRSLQVFVITAALALFITGASWFCVDQFNDNIAWRRRNVETAYTPPTHTSFLIVRLTMIVWLIHNGHLSWRQKSGVWPLLLRDSHREPSWYPNGLPQDARYLSAGEYVSKFSRERRNDGFDPFATSSFSLNWHVYSEAIE